MEWQPIETAPKDGTRVLLYSQGGDGTDETREIAEGAWGNFDYRDDQMWCMAAGDGWMGVTHWMPLPDPPPQEDAE